MKLTFNQKIISGSLILGFIFPLLAFVISVHVLGLPYTFQSLIIIHQNSPALYLVDMAPIVLFFVAVIITRMVDERGAKRTKIIRQQVEKSIKVEKFIHQLENSNYDIKCELAESGDKIGIALENLKNNLHLNKSNEDNRTWINEGVVHFANIQRDNNESIEALAQKTIQELIKHIDAQFGGFYLFDDTRKKHVLKLIGSYAYDFKVKEKQSFEVGEGLVGQCQKDKELLYFDDIPEDYQYNIESGLGMSSPSILLFVPLIANEISVGVIEIASFNKLEKHQIEFINELAETIALSINSVRTINQTKDLLEESQFMSHQLQAQEEELRQNAEELQATQEEIERKLIETENILVSERRKINSIVNTSAESIILVNESGEIKEFNPSFAYLFGYSKVDMDKLTFKELFNTKNEFLIHINQIMENEEEVNLKTKQGGDIWVKILVNQIEVNGIAHYSVFFTDFTETRRNIADMEESLKEFQSFMIEQADIQGKIEEELESVKKELEGYKK